MTKEERDTKYRESHREQRRLAEKARRERVKHTRTDKPFVGVDGEGGNIDGRHYYTCLRAGDRELYTGAPLSTSACLEFIGSLPAGFIYVGYYFGYDVSMILGDLGQERLNRLLDRDSRKIRVGTDREAFMPLDWGDRFDIDLIGGFKEFRVRDRWRSTHYVTIYDCAGIFQSSFLKAIKAWNIGTEEDWAIIEEGKSARSSFTEATDEIRRYNHLECKLLAQMMESVRDACNAVNIYPNKWTGAGQLAESLLRTHHMESYQGELPPVLEKPAATAYFGGRFEILRQGILNDVWEYDINSAYPDAMQHLPCLAHGEWTTGVRSEIYLVHLQWAGTDRYDRNDPGPFPFRQQDGTIVYPASGRGWYWSWEVETAKEIGLWNITIDKAWSWVQECDHKPASWVPALYDYRKSLGGPRGQVLKLAINSLYGKTAQNIGHPKFRSIVMAGLITSYVRARLLRDAYRQGGCVMFATDAVYFQSEAKFETGDQLGQYGVQHFQSYFILQPGIHFSIGGELSKKKTRGVPIRLLDPDRIVMIWRERGRDGGYRFEYDKFWGIRLCNQTNHMEMLGQWTVEPKTLAYASVVAKRMYEDSEVPVPPVTEEGQFWRLLAYEFAPLSLKESVVYERAMKMAPESIEFYMAMENEPDYPAYYQEIEGLKDA